MPRYEPKVLWTPHEKIGSDLVGYISPKASIVEERSNMLMIHSVLARVFSTVALNESSAQARLHISIIFLFCPNCKCTQMPPTEEFLCVTKGRPFRADHKALPHHQNQKHYFSWLLPDCCESLSIMKEKIY